MGTSVDPELPETYPISIPIVEVDVQSMAVTNRADRAHAFKKGGGKGGRSTTNGNHVCRRRFGIAKWRPGVVVVRPLSIIGESFLPTICPGDE